MLRNCSCRLVFIHWALCTCAALLLAAATSAAKDEDTHFTDGTLPDWDTRDGKWSVADGRAIARGGFSLLTKKGFTAQDVSVEADVATHHDGPFACAGVAFRLGDDGGGYLAGVREVARGNDTKHGPWERPLLQLYRMDRAGGWKLLQEAKVLNARDGKLLPLKIVCRGPRIWVYYDDLTTPILREFDDHYVRAGRAGLFKDQLGEGLFDRAIVTALPADAVDPAPPPDKTDWSWVRGAVYVRSNAVNSVQMWHDYWDHTAVLDRELGYAKRYGFNMVQVYLHWIVYDRHQAEYLQRIDDFLTRADRHGLKTNLIFWDDCGHVEPALEFAAPVPGRHNSQMMPNPSHRIRDDAQAFDSHRAKFGEYVQAVAGRFKDDRRIAFWQLYNEPLGPVERYRTSAADANINRLLSWTRDWVKGTGTKIPVTATGGGFYGPKYSDFYTYHSYRMTPTGPLPHADGGPEHLCTETLCRPTLDVVGILDGLVPKQNGFVVWELMIGRDNCRFPWGHSDGPQEPTAPFHGVVYPDGHPWDLREVQALLGEKMYAALEAKSFRAEYFTGRFTTLKKTSLVPAIDFALGTEAGTGSPDASAGIGQDDFSIRYQAKFVASTTGKFTFTSTSDGPLRLNVGDTQVIDVTDPPHGAATGGIELTTGQTYSVTIEYTHRTGAAHAQIRWAGPGFGPRVFTVE